MYILTGTRTCTHMHTLTGTHTCTHRYTHMYIQVHTHAYIYQTVGPMKTEKKTFCLSWHFSPCSLSQCLAHTRYSTNVYGMND